MNSEQMQKFKEIVENSNTIAIRVGSLKVNDISKILAGALLHQAFQKLGKKVSIDVREGEAISAFFNPPLADFGKEESILVKFDTEKIPVSELRYEKDGKLMKIILKSETAGKTSLDLREIFVEKETVPVDLLLMIDPPEAEIEFALGEVPHKDVVKLGAKDKCLSYKIKEIFETLFKEIPAELKEALWFFIKYEKRMDWSVGEMREEKIKSANETLFGENFLRLFGRALARSHFEKETQTFWAFLPKSDFEKTGNKDSVVLKILNELRALRPESRFFTLLWETAGEQKNIGALVASQNRTLLQNLASLMSSAPASSYFFANGFRTFSEAELKIRSSIKQVL